MVHALPFFLLSSFFFFFFFFFFTRYNRVTTVLIHAEVFVVLLVLIYVDDISKRIPGWIRV